MAFWWLKACKRPVRMGGNFVHRLGEDYGKGLSLFSPFLSTRFVLWVLVNPLNISLGKESQGKLRFLFILR